MEEQPSLGDEDVSVSIVPTLRRQFPDVDTFDRSYAWEHTLRMKRQRRGELSSQVLGRDFTSNGVKTIFALSLTSAASCAGVRKAHLLICIPKV